MRKRLLLLSGAFARAAVLYPESAAGRRRSLREASEECEMLARTLPPLAWLGSVLPFLATSLTIYGSFFAIPHLDVNDKSLSLLSNVVVKNGVIVFSFLLFLNLAPLLFLSRSAWCQQALLSPARLRERWQDKNKIGASELDVAYLEKEAFRQAGSREPPEWGVHAWLRGSTMLGYTLCIGVTALLWIGITATLVLLAGAAFWMLVILGTFKLDSLKRKRRTRHVL